MKRDNQKKKLSHSVLAVIGGGRWGRLIVSILATMDLPFEQVVIVTHTNTEHMKEVISTFSHKASSTFTVIRSLDELLTEYTVYAAIIVNAARQHFNTASHLLNSRIPILMEKPLVLSKKEMEILLSKSAKYDVCLVPGLQYRFCNYIHDFAEHMKRLCKNKPQNFSVVWSDQANEVRYGETKTYDSSIDVAQDVMPHIWSILFILFQQNVMTLNSCRVTNNGLHADFSAILDSIPGHIILKRNGEKRQRLISIQIETEKTLTLDFSTEPGTVFLNKDIIETNIDWNITQRPLIRQLNYFLRVMRESTSEQDRHACVESVSFCEKASILLQANDH